MTYAITLYSMPVDAGDYRLIRSFCEDFGIPNVVDRENCFFSLNAGIGILKGLPPLQGGYLMNELELIEFESMEGQGRILAISGFSPVLEQAFIDNTRMLMKHEVDVIEEEPNISVIISSDIGDGEFDLDELSLRLKEYVGDTLAFVEVRTRIVTLKDYELLVDGKLVEE